MDRRTLIKQSLVAGASLTAAVDWLLANDWNTPASAAAAPGTRYGTTDAQTLWTQARQVLAEDNKRGGRAVRTRALTLLNDTALPMLDGRFATEHAEKSVRAAVAYVGHLNGWVAVDDGDVFAAQQLFTASLQLANRSGDPIVAAGILTDMAHLEHLTGTPETGIRLAQAAQKPGPERLPAAILARAASMEARCHARLGNVADTRSAMGRAEDYLARPVNADPHPLDFFFNYEQLHTELHPAVLGLVVAGKAKPDTVFDHARLIGAAPHMGRRAAMVAADAATAHLIAGDFDTACGHADAAIAAAAPLRGGSGRVLGALNRVQTPLANYTPTSGDARDLAERLRRAAPAKLAV